MTSDSPQSPRPHDEAGAPAKGALRDSAFGSLTTVLNIIGTVLIIVMALAVNADVLGRDLFNHPIPGVTEFIGLSIVAVVFLQMANTLREDRHIANDIILQWLGQSHPRVSHAFYGLFHLIGAGLMGLIVWYVWPMFVEMYRGDYFKGTAGVVEIPIWPFVLTIIIGGLTSLVQYLLFAAREFALALARAGERRR